MTAAAIVTGNTVELKPSPDAAVTAAHFVDLLHELGLPPGVVNYVPGDALTVGETLVADRRTRFVSFTGSKAVGAAINEVAAATAPGQKWMKRVVAEMGRGRTRSSSPPTPTWSRRPPASWPRPSVSAARSARRARGRSSIRRSTIAL